MKISWIIIGLVVIVVAIVVLSALDIIPLDWQKLTIIGAAIAGPFKALFDKIGGKDIVDDIVAKHAKIREDDETYKKEIDSKIQEQQSKLTSIEAEIEVKNAKLEVIEEKKKRVVAETKVMTLEQTKSEAKALFGE